MKYVMVVFDLAGTTVRDDRDVHKVLRRTLSTFGVNITMQQANDVMGIPKPLAITKLLKLHNYHDVDTLLVERIHAEFVENMIDFYKHDPSVGEKTGVSDTFAALKKFGIKVAVDTGFSRDITTALLQRLGWEDNQLIDSSITSDEVRKGRPYPDMILESMHRLDVSDPSKVVKVGDTIFDIQQGRAARCGLTVGVTTGAFSYEELEDEGPDFLIREIPEILELI